MRAQNIVLVLSDGRKITATVPEFWDGTTDMAVREVKVGESYELPEGYHFSSQPRRKIEHQEASDGE